MRDSSWKHEQHRAKTLKNLKKREERKKFMKKKKKQKMNIDDNDLDYHNYNSYIHNFNEEHAEDCLCQECLKLEKISLKKTHEYKVKKNLLK